MGREEIVRRVPSGRVSDPRSASSRSTRMAPDVDIPLGASPGATGPLDRRPASSVAVSLRTGCVWPVSEHRMPKATFAVELMCGQRSCH
ncbi:hypothetical protein C0Q93_30440 [Streptomyces albidoflavus]|nr:hypothetical protein C0Q93_30440 [Streptomyces albidoflavus]